MARFLLFLLLLFGGSIQPIMSQDPSAGTSSTIINSATAPNAGSLSTPATSTTAAAGASTDAGKGSPFKLGEMIWIILLGGFANYLRTSGQLKPHAVPPQLDPLVPAGETNGTTLPPLVPTTDELGLYLLTCLVLGVVASALVPLFLNSLSSELLIKRTDRNLLIFIGFCLLAAISSSSFIDALTQRILNQMKNLRDQTVTEANRAAENKQQTEALKEHTETLLESVRSEQESLREKTK